MPIDAHDWTAEISELSRRTDLDLVDFFDELLLKVGPEGCGNVESSKGGALLTCAFVDADASGRAVRAVTHLDTRKPLERSRAPLA